MLSHRHRREKETMNGESKRDIALGALALGVGVALGAVIGNDATRKSLVDKGKSWINEYRQN
jgi:predicted ArsR family transcriptional regulator